MIRGGLALWVCLALLSPGVCAQAADKVINSTEKTRNYCRHLGFSEPSADFNYCLDSMRSREIREVQQPSSPDRPLVHEHAPELREAWSKSPADATSLELEPTSPVGQAKGIVPDNQMAGDPVSHGKSRTGALFETASKNQDARAHLDEVVRNVRRCEVDGYKAGTSEFDACYQRLASGAETGSPAAGAPEQTRADQSLLDDRVKCQAYGFQLGTESFATCMLMRERDREERETQKEQLARELEAAEQRKREELQAYDRMIDKQRRCSELQRELERIDQNYEDGQAQSGGFAGGLASGLSHGLQSGRIQKRMREMGC